MSINLQPIDARHTEPSKRYGTVVRLYGSTLVTTSDAGGEQSHSIAAHAHVTKYGRPCRSSDIGVGTRVRITMSSRDQCIAAEIECLRRPGSS